MPELGYVARLIEGAVESTYGSYERTENLVHIRFYVSRRHEING